MSLKDRSCKPCKKGAPPLGEPEIALLAPEVRDWTVSAPDPAKPRRLDRRFEFKNFLGSMAFLNLVAGLAEAEQHHPDLCVHYNRVDVSLSTHDVNGLSENDFILAAKINAMTNVLEA